MKSAAKVLGVGAALMGSVTAVIAQGTGSTLLPPIIQQLFDALGIGGSGVAGFITTKGQFGIYLVLGVIVLVAVVYVIMAGIKYIRSEGDPGKIEEAQKSIKAILMGVAAIFVGIIGIVLVYVIFGQGMVTPSLPQVCLSSSESYGCKKYYENGPSDDAVKWCEGYFQAATNLRVDAILKKNVTDVTKAAMDAGYVPPATVSISTSQAYRTEEAGFLCLSPAKGGYIPVATPK